MKESKENETFLIELNPDDLKKLELLSKKSKTTVDVLIEEALIDLLRKYNKI